MFLLNPTLRYVEVVWPARGKTITDYQRKLEASGARIQQRLAQVSESPRRHAIATHIIAIERWAQQHLKALIDNTTHNSESLAHRPAQDTTWSDLAPLFAQTRAETLALLPDLKTVPAERTTTHNDLGAFTAVQWLQYIEAHGAFELLRIR